MLKKAALHGQVVPVRVDADSVCSFKAESQRGGKHAPEFAGRSYPVNGAVGERIRPASLTNDLIGWLVPDEEHENACGYTALHDQKQSVILNIADEQLLIRISVVPLIGVAMLRHEAARVGIDGKYFGQIPGICKSYFHIFNQIRAFRRFGKP